MADVDLTQEEAEALIAMPKIRTSDDIVYFPGRGNRVTIHLISDDKRENFILDLRRGRIDLHKATYQTRARQTIVLVRLDIAGAPHRNPDDVEIGCPHLHIYREGFGTRWAEPLPEERFSNTLDLWKMLQDFMGYCNITRPPNIQKGIEEWKR